VCVGADGVCVSVCVCVLEMTECVCVCVGADGVCVCVCVCRS